MKIEIIDARGSLVLSKNVNSYNDDYHEKLNINHFPSGIYYIKITGKGKSLTKTLIKQ